MENKDIKKRIEKIKIENDSINKALQGIEEERMKLINKALTNNGRILELEDILKIKKWQKK